MKPKFNLLFAAYQWIIALPILLILTIITAILTIILSPLLPNSEISYFPARWWGRFFCYLMFIKVEINGLANINPQESYVFVSNHQSIYDVFVVYGWFPMFFKWIMKAELRRIPLVGKACEAAGHVFIDRTNPIVAQKSLDKAKENLVRGVSVVIFPEGTRTYDGEVGKFKKGAFRIAADLKLAIIPVTIKGAYQCLPRDRWIVHPGRIHVTLHTPIDVQPYLPDKMQELMDATREVIMIGLK